MEVSGRVKGQTSYDGIYAGSEELPDLFCQPCINDGDVTAATGFCEDCQEYFCSACLKLHRKQSISRQHSILDGTCMPKGPQGTSGGDSCSEICRKHNTNVVQYFCKTHDVVGCGECRELDHASCKVTMVKDQSDNFDKSGELKEIQERIDQVRRNIGKIKHEIAAKVIAVTDNHKDILADIRAFRKEVNEQLDKMESDIIRSAERLKSDKEKTLSDVEETCRALETEIVNMVMELQPKSNNNDLFVKAKLAKKRLTKISSEIKSLEDQSEITNHKYIREASLSKLSGPSNKLGDITTDILSKIVEDFRPKYVGEINLKQENEIVCYITDAVFMEENKAILVDRNNTCVKLLDVSRRKVLFVFKVDNRPFGIARVNHDLVAVTIPAAREIQFLSCTTELSERFSIQVNGECVGIACEDNMLALTYNMPSKIEILTVTGTLLHSIQTGSNKIPSYVIFGPEPYTVFVSNYHKKKVIKMDFDGQVLASYRDMVYQTRPL